jgi:hypothetical protein
VSCYVVKKTTVLYITIYIYNITGIKITFSERYEIEFRNVVREVLFEFIKKYIILKLIQISRNEIVTANYPIIKTLVTLTYHSTFIVIKFLLDILEISSL